MDFLPTEILEKILQYLPPVSLLSCSEAAPQFAQLINGDVFLDRYCQNLLQADWIKWEMILAVRKSLPLILEMWYLSDVTACHPNLLLNGSEDLHSIGIFIYTINTWLLKKSRNRQCVDCHGMLYLRSVISHSDGLGLFMKLAMFVPECIVSTLMYSNRVSRCGEKPYNLDFMLSTNDAIHPEYLNNFDCKYSLEVILYKPHFLVYSSACILVSDDFWIGWTGLVDYVSFLYVNTETRCKLAMASSVDDTREAMKTTFSHFDEPHIMEFQPMRPHEPMLINFGTLLEELAHKVNKKLDHFGLNMSVKIKLKIYLDGCRLEKTKHEQMDSASQSSTFHVSVLRYFHRAVNNIFYNECMRYLENQTCAKFLVGSEEKRKGIPWLVPFEQFKKHLSIHNLSPKLWPRHLLRHAITAAPIVSQLVQLDIMLWLKGLHCHPISDKIIKFLIDQTESCGLSCDKSHIVYPPLCGLVSYSDNEPIYL